MEESIFIIIIIIIITGLCTVFAHIQMILFEGQHGTLTKFLFLVRLNLRVRHCATSWKDADSISDYVIV